MNDTVQVLNNKLETLIEQKIKIVNRLDTSIERKLRLISKCDAKEISRFRKDILLQRKEKRKQEAKLDAEIDLTTKRLLFIQTYREKQVQKPL